MELSTIYVTLGAIKLYPYGLMVCLGGAVALALFVCLAKQKDKSDAPYLALPLMVVFALVFSRLLYACFDESFWQVKSLQNLLTLSNGGMSMMGALIGSAIGLALAYRATRSKALLGLDALSVAAPAFVFFARLGERFTSIGISRSLTGKNLKASLFVFEDTYGHYLKTFVLEALVAAALFIVLYLFYRQQKKKGATFMRFLLLFGASQTVLESLRYDAHMRFSFISVQQIIAITLFGVALIVLAKRNWKEYRGQTLSLLILLPVVIGVGLAIEFMIDRSPIADEILYLAYIAVLCIPTFIALRLLSLEERHGKTSN
jgi:prolipoprotein diacylglyceryltransferase